MATVTNKSLNTGTMTNKEIMSQTKLTTWDGATFTWEQAHGTWDNPWAIVNKALNTGTVTNRAIS